MNFCTWRDCDMDKRSQSLDLALQHIKNSHYSKHWDVFDENFRACLRDSNSMENFRNNNISYLLDDNNTKVSSEIINLYVDQLLLKVDSDFINKFKEGKIGNPRVFKSKIGLIDYNDIFLLNFFQTLRPFMEKNERIIYAEVGGGYGGLANKVKLYNTNSCICLFDLPEVNAISHFYLKKNFPSSRIFTFTDFCNVKYKLDLQSISLEYDFIILPGWTMEAFPNQIFDISVNTRSFMEMNIETVHYYFNCIQKCSKIDSVFYCVNRYEKSTVGHKIRFKDYPFDNRWYPVISNKSFMQPAIHELLCVRSRYDSIVSFKNFSKELEPFSMSEIWALIRKMKRIVSLMIRGFFKSLKSVQYIVKVLNYQKKREKIIAKRR